MTSSSYDAMSTEELLRTAQRKNRALTEERLAAAEAEAKMAEREAKRQETGGFWDLFVGASLEEVGADFLSTFGGDEASVSTALANYEALVHGMFDPEALLAGYSAGVVPGDVVSLDRQFGDAAAPASLIERTIDPSRKDQYGVRACQRGLIQATAAAGARVVAGAVGNAVRAVKTVQTSLGFLREAVPDLAAGMMNLPTQSLLAILGSQDLILRRIVDVTRKINAVVADMGETDYPADHVELVRRQQLRLQDADDKLAALEARLLAGAAFNQPLWDGAKRDIDEAAQALCTFDLKILIGGITFKPFVLVGLVLYLETLLRVLRRQQAARALLSGFLGGFETAFLEELRFDNLFLPVIDLVRCRLKRIVEDMDATIGVNRFLHYLLKEKQWCLELKALSAMMRLSDKLRLPENLNVFLGTKALDDAAQAVFDFLGSQQRKLADASVDEVLRLGFAFVSVCRRKATTNLPSAAVVSLGLDLIRTAEACIGTAGPYGGVLNAFSGSAVVYAASAILVVGQVMEFAEERKLTGFTAALQQGDLCSAFGLDGLTASLEGQLTALVAKTIEITRSTGGNPVAEAELAVVQALFQDEARNLGLVDSLLNDNGSAHIEERLEVDAPRYKESEARLQRAAAALEVQADPAEATFVPASTAKAKKLSAVST